MCTSTERSAKWRRGLGAGLAGLVLTVGGVALVAPAAGAQSDSGGQTQTQTQDQDQDQDHNGGPRQRPELTDEQKACLEENGATKPAEGQKPTDEQREAFKAAAEKCGIELPARGEGGHPGRPQLTDEQRACLQEQGVEKPARGEKPTDEQRAKFEAAAEECGVTLPDAPPAPDSGSQNQGS